MELNYDNIQAEAEAFAAWYRRQHDVPALPNSRELQKYKELLHTKYGQVVELVKERVSQVDPEGGHGFEHLEEIATLAGYIAEKECAHLGIAGEEKDNIITKAVLSGILHDIERHLGFGEDHMIEGENTAKRILERMGITDEIVTTVVRNHDHIDFNPGSDNILSVVFGSVFDADHFRYGLEREDTFWRMKEKKGKSADEVIHDFQFLPQFRNAWRTEYGREIGPKLIDFGLAVAKHLEKFFS